MSYRRGQKRRKNGPQQQNCAWEVCCDSPEAQEALIADARADGCETMEEIIEWLFEYHTLAPRSFVAVKKEIGEAALAGR